MNDCVNMLLQKKTKAQFAQEKEFLAKTVTKNDLIRTNTNGAEAAKLQMFKCG